MNGFLSADEVSRTEIRAKVYLYTRFEDFIRFLKDVKPTVFSTEWNARHTFDNGYMCQFYDDGSVQLSSPECQAGRSGYCNIFDTFEQFAAYYLAKFW